MGVAADLAVRWLVRRHRVWTGAQPGKSESAGQHSPDILLEFTKQQGDFHLMARILIVDDSPSQLLGIKRIVEKLGHETLTAEDGAAGVDVAKREKPDLILMDVVMPNLNGFQATRTISKDPETAGIPIVLVTTKDQETDKVWGIRQGAKAYVTKPIKEEELVAVLKELLPA